MKKYNIKTYETLENKFEKYWKVRSLVELRVILLKPYLSLFLKEGFDKDEIFLELLKSNIKIINRYKNKELLLDKYCKLIWDKIFIEIRAKLFVKPFLKYLRSQGIIIGESTQKENFGLIEHLIKIGLGATEIAYQLDFCSRKDKKEIIEKHRSFIRGFIKTRWNKTIPEAQNHFKERGLGKQELDEYKKKINKS